MDGKAIIDAVRVDEGHEAGLASRDPADTLDIADRKAGKATVEKLGLVLDELHDRLWAEATRSVLLVLQGMDASGKDGAIRNVLSGLNPQGCTVVGFKAPSDVEKAHDYLWRVHGKCPERGHLGVFNRSHYEDVLAARFAGHATVEQCRLRYRHLREFERMLTEEGTTLVKVYLHISKEEQRDRLQTRVDDPAKNWKFSDGDVKERRAWSDYQDAYEAAVQATATKHAPWYVVPANHKWYAHLVIASTIIEALEDLDLAFPETEKGKRKELQKIRDALLAEKD